VRSICRFFLHIHKVDAVFHTACPVHYIKSRAARYVQWKPVRIWSSLPNSASARIMKYAALVWVTRLNGDTTRLTSPGTHPSGSSSNSCHQKAIPFKKSILRYSSNSSPERNIFSAIFLPPHRR
jgi:hypothetical protein